MAVNRPRSSSISEKIIDSGASQNEITFQQGVFSLLTREVYNVEMGATPHGVVRANRMGPSPQSSTEYHDIVTFPVKDCNLDVYGSAHCSKDDIFMNRARLCEISTNGNALRLGSRIFFKSDWSTEGSLDQHFDVSEMSFYADHIERLGQYLFVTSRQKLLELPTEKSTDVEDKKDKKVKKSSETIKDKKDNTSDSDSESVESKSDFSVESEALSAYESWSEASTEHSETEVLKDTRPQYTAIPGDKKEDAKNSASANEGSSSSEDETHESEDNDTDAESVAAPNMRYAHVMDDEEEDQMLGMIWDDPDEPGYDGDEYAGAWGNSDNSDDDSGRNQDVNDSDTDADSEKDEKEKQKETKDTETKETESKANESVKGSEKEPNGVQDSVTSIDAEKKSENESKSIGDANELAEGKAPVLEAEKESNEKSKEEGKSPPTLLGSNMSQLHVYDLSASPPKRIFRFARPIMQQIRDSPLAVHPNKSLVVWPLGDNNMLFADYQYNTYFVRKFRVSRFWSQHVKIECRFSSDGKYLHVASLEMRRNLPTKKKSSGSNKKSMDEKSADEEAKAQKKEEEETMRPECDLLILTYKLSSRKTTRAPPVLVHRTQLPLGKIWLAKSLPTFTWTSKYVFIAHAVEEDLKVIRVTLSKIMQDTNRKGPATVHVPKAPYKIGNSDDRTEVYFLPAGVNEKKAKVVVTTEHPALKSTPRSAVNNNSGKDRTEDLKSEVAAEAEDDISAVSKETANNNIKRKFDERRINIIKVELLNDDDGWEDIDASQLNKSVEDGMGQMEVEMVKFDRTEDCECCDD